MNQRSIHRQETSLYFIGEKAGDERVLFNALAPFVQPSSFIHFRGEDGECWRWVFDGAKVKCDNAVVSFPENEDENEF